MNLEKFMEWLLAWLGSMAPRVLGAVIVVVLGLLLSKALVKLLKKALERGKAEAGVITFVGSLVNIALKVLVGITAAAQLGFDVTSIITAIGALGVTIGLALKDSMSNVASGVQILFNHIFRVGDYLSVEGVEGTVDRIEIMYTALRTFDNKEIIIPNSELTASVITNYTAQTTRRLDLSYSVSYSTNLAQARGVLEGLINSNEKVIDEPAPLIAVGEHKDSCIMVIARVWCRTDDYWPLYFEMQEAVKNAFDEAGIEIPFPQLDVHTKS